MCDIVLDSAYVWAFVTFLFQNALVLFFCRHERYVADIPMHGSGSCDNSSGLHRCEARLVLQWHVYVPHVHDSGGANGDSVVE
jgi:hypothetical protein